MHYKNAEIVLRNFLCHSKFSVFPGDPVFKADEFTDVISSDTSKLEDLFCLSGTTRGAAGVGVGGNLPFIFFRSNLEYLQNLLGYGHSNIVESSLFWFYVGV